MESQSDQVFVCFEGVVPPEQEARSSQFYSAMQELVLKQTGFISETGFASIDQEGGQVLYVKFDNEEHLREWRKQRTHMKIQSIAREKIFSNYRIRIGQSVVQNTGDEPLETAGDQYIMIWQTPIIESGETGPKSLLDGVEWQSNVDASTYVNLTHILHVSSWTDLNAATEMRDSLPRTKDDEVQLIRVQRDYGKYERKDAPQDAEECQKSARQNEDIVVPV